MCNILIGIANAGSSIPSTGTTTPNAQSVEQIFGGMASDIVSLFSDNIGTVLTFAVSFMALALLLALGRRFFRL